MLQIFFVDVEYFLVRTKDICDITAFFIVERGYGTYPFIGLSFTEGREFYIFGIIADSPSYIVCAKKRTKVMFCMDNRPAVSGKCFFGVSLFYRLYGHFQ